MRDALLDAASRRSAAAAAAAPPASPRDRRRAIDLTGYWVSVVTEDWKFRMVTPKKGVFDALPLNAEGRRVGDTWDPAKDEAAGEQCRGVRRRRHHAHPRPPAHHVAGRRHAEDRDRRRHADTHCSTSATPRHPASSSWQGHSTARSGNARRAAALQGGNLKVVTTNLRPGYVRKNGAPYSEKTTVTEYFDLNTMPNGDSGSP